MKELKKELILHINRNLYQKKIINFEEFKLITEEILKEEKNEYIKN